MNSASNAITIAGLGLCGRNRRPAPNIGFHIVAPSTPAGSRPNRVVSVATDATAGIGRQDRRWANIRLDRDRASALGGHSGKRSLWTGACGLVRPGRPVRVAGYAGA